MSKENLSRPQDLAAFNSLNGTELTEHDASLTLEQAEAINEKYTIEIYVGRHGLLAPKGSLNQDELLSLPGQQDYDAAAAVVDEMQPGDVLFTENYGFKRQPPGAISIPDKLPNRPFETPTDTLMRLRSLAEAHQIRTAELAQLERKRQAYEIDAWDYARQLAVWKGITTRFADHDAFDESNLLSATQGRKLEVLTLSDDPADRSVARHVHNGRAIKARNIIKDWALSDLASENYSELENRKPKLVLLFGYVHPEDLERAFGDIGLDFSTIAMEQSNEQDRAYEQAVRLQHEALKRLMPDILDAEVELPSSED